MLPHWRVRAVELPPRARRIQVAAGGPSTHLGTTSACAENTRFVAVLLLGLWNYLRVRGEYAVAMASAMRRVELPPRARGIHHP